MPNGDIDSIPGNGAETEDDFAKAELMISISTGAVMYISIAVIALLIFVGLYFAIRFKLIKINRLSAFGIIFITMLLVMNNNVMAYVDPANFTFNRSMMNYIGGYDSEGNPIYPYRNEWTTSDGKKHYDSIYFNNKNFNDQGVQIVSDALCIEPRVSVAPAGASYSIPKVNGSLTAGVSYTDYYYGKEEYTEEDNIRFTLTNDPNEIISIRLVGDNYILGPFKINATNYTGGYTFALYDRKGTEIKNIATCDSTGWEVDITGSTPFYIKVAQSDCTNGISKLTAEGTRTGEKRTYRDLYGKIIYEHSASTQKIKTIGEYYIERKLVEDEPIHHSDDVEWVNFTGGLQIIKQDADDINVKLPGVEINVKCDSVGYNETFTTDENGEILIDNLLPGTYIITEIANNHYGYANIESEEVQIYGGSFRKYGLTNEKETGNLRIEKKDADNNNVLQGVSFRIRKNISAEDATALEGFISGKGDVDGNGYLEEADLQIILRYVSEKVELTEEEAEQADVNGDGEVDIVDMRLLLRRIQSAEYVVGMEYNTAGELTPITTATGTVYFDSMETTNNEKDATTFVTDENGLIQIYNILTGTYIIDEVSVGDNFGYDIDDNYILWEINGETGSGNNMVVEVARQRSYKTVEQTSIITDSLKTIEDGTYEIESGLDSNVVLDVGHAYPYNGANVNVHQRVGSIAQKFYVKYLGDGYYSIISLANNKYLDVESARTTPGTIVHTWDFNDTDAQKWLFQDEGNGYYSFISKCNSLYMDVKDALTANYTNIQVNILTYSKAEHFKLNDWYEVSDEDFTTVVDKNRRKFIKINGYAWEEKTDGKNSTKDSIYNDESTDRRLEHVTVRLKDANGNIITDGNKIAETTTNENGEYVFGNYDEDPNAMKLEIDKLVGAYIEFEYNGMSYQTIDVNSVFSNYTETTSNGNTVMKYTSNTNKATDEALRDAFNNNYATISQGISSDANGNKTYDIRYNYDSTNHESKVIYGDNVLYGYEGQAYPIAGVDPQYTIQAVTAQSETNVLCTGVTAEKIRQDAVVEIGGLNLGVEERAMPDLAIIQDMEHVQISLNEYTHTYQYARRFDDPSEYAGGDPFDTTVRFANKYIEN